MHDVFVSYSRADRAFVDRLVNHITGADFTCWLDTKDLPPAEVWRQELEDAIIDADNFIFVVSPDSIDSKVCNIELQFALRHNKRIIPLLYRRLRGRQNLPDSLAERQWLEIDRIAEEKGFELIPPIIRNERKWYNQATEYLRRAANWESDPESGGLLPLVEMAAARSWIEMGTKITPGPSELQIRYINESEAYHLREAQRWKDLYSKALARQLAAQAEVMIGQRGILLETAALLAVESMRRFPTIEGDRAIRKALCLLPRRIAEMKCAAGIKIKEAAFRPEGSCLAILTNDDLVRVWDCLAGKEVSNFKVPHCLKVIFCPTQRQIVTVKTVATVWDMMRGAEVIQLSHHDVLDAAYSHDGQFLVTVGSDNTMRLWDTDDYEEFARYQNSETMQHVAIASEAAELIAWNQSKAEVFRAPGVSDSTIELGATVGVSFEYSSDGKRLSQVGAGDYTASLYDVASREQLIFEERHWHVAFSGDGEHYALASPEWDAHTYFLPSCQQAGHYWKVSERASVARKHIQRRVSCSRGNSVRHDNSVNTVALSEKGNYLGTTSRDGTARVWEPYRGREVLRLLEAVQGNIYRLAFHRNERFVTGWGNDGFKTWEAAGHRQVAELVHGDAVFDVSFSLDGRYAATVSKDGTARVWEIPAATEVARQDVSTGFDRHTVSLSRDGGKLLVDGYIMLDAASGRSAGNILRDEKTKITVPSVDWKVVVNVREDNFIAVLAFETGEMLAQLKADEDRVTKIAVSASNSYVAIVSEKNDLRLWNWSSGRIIEDIATGTKVRAMDFSRSGSKLVLLNKEDNRVVDVWDIETKRLLRHLQHEARVTGASLNPAEDHLVSSSDDRSVRIWNLESGSQVAQFEHDADVATAKFSPDGRYVLSAGGRSDRAARLWFWQPEDLIAETCSRLSRDLTAEEWSQYIGDEPYRPTCQLEEEK